MCPKTISAGLAFVLLAPVHATTGAQGAGAGQREAAVRVAVELKARPLFHAPDKNPYARLFEAPAPAAPQRTVEARAPSARPRVVCGMTIIPADPTIDPGIVVATPQSDGVTYAIRRITPPVCAGK
jgi:hypothetical protein